MYLFKINRCHYEVPYISIINCFNHEPYKYCFSWIWSILLSLKNYFSLVSFFLSKEGNMINLFCLKKLFWLVFFLLKRRNIANPALFKKLFFLFSFPKEEMRSICFVSGKFSSFLLFEKLFWFVFFLLKRRNINNLVLFKISFFIRFFLSKERNFINLALFFKKPLLHLFFYFLKEGINLALFFFIKLSFIYFFLFCTKEFHQSHFVLKKL